MSWVKKSGAYARRANAEARCIGVFATAVVTLLLACKQENEAPPLAPQSGYQAPVAAAPTPGPALETGPQAVSTPLEQARVTCVARINEFRARVGVAPVARRADAEACGDAQARSDATSGTAHGTFGQCRERAQNECPGWPGTPQDVIERCLAMMFAEGPGSGPAHGHYTNLTDPQYRGVSCGISATANGELWVVQNFYP